MKDLNLVPMVKYLEKCTLPLFTKDNLNQFFIKGTGIIVNYNEHNLIVTAGHVLVGKVYIRTLSGSYVPLEDFYFTEKNLDIGCVPIRNSGAILARQYTRLHIGDNIKEESKIEEGDRLLVTGFPSNKNNQRLKPSVNKLPLGLCLSEIATDINCTEFQGYNPDMHLIVHRSVWYKNRHNLSSKKLPNLEGMSGGGIWRIHLYNELEYIMHLVGFTIEQKVPNKKFFIGINLSCLVLFLDDVIQALQALQDKQTLL